MSPFRRSLLPMALLFGAGLHAAPSRADDPKPEAAPEKPVEGKPADAKAPDAPKAPDAKPAETPKPPATVVVEKGPFSVALDLPAVFEAVGAVDVKYHGEAYGGELEVLESVPAGPVEAGQVLVRLSPEKIDEQIQAVARDVEIARRVQQIQQEDAKRAQEASDLAVDRAKAEKDRSDRALKTFLETDRELRVKETEQRVQGTKDAITDQTEELAQLTKMYKADDVVEETEDLVMKRAQRQLERTKIGLGFQLIRQRYLLENELPEEERGLKLNARKETGELDRLLASVATSLERSKLELAKAEAGFTKQVEGLEKLKKDREALVVKAPRAGIAIPGGCVRGRWAGVDETTRSLEKGGKVRADTPLYTIVEPGAVTVKTAVAEAVVLSLATGIPAEVTPGSDLSEVLPAKVTRIARVATEGGFEVTLELGRQDARLMPGFTCKVKLKTVERADTLTVPSGSVATDGDKKVVWVLGDEKATGEDVKDGATSKEVRVGASSGGRTEILDGVVAGTRILKNPPKS